MVLRHVVGFLRSHAGMTQAQFGKAARIDQAEISRYELGYLAPSEEALRRMAKAAQIDWGLVVHLRQFYNSFLATVANHPVGREGGGVRKGSDKRRSPLGLALTYLRSAAGWTKSQLGSSVGVSRDLVSHYERNAKHLTRERLDFLVEGLVPAEAVDVLLTAHDLIYPEPQEGVSSPVALSSQEQEGINRAAMAAGWNAGRIAAESVRSELIRRNKQQKAVASKQEAENLFQRLMPLTREERTGLVEAFPDYWSWALAVRVCEASVKSAAHKAGEALELAELAVSIADRVSGEESWRSRLKS
ncbi:MAG TPA: helix-turn-helix transcriptional regulator, partial [Thermoanaerobaculia bacterium]|nr:helix-turn-helix transcriptional regulator [Thermoanaerobaculia bacterium]